MRIHPPDPCSTWPNAAHRALGTELTLLPCVRVKARRYALSGPIHLRSGERRYGVPGKSTILARGANWKGQGVFNSSGANRHPALIEGLGLAGQGKAPIGVSGAHYTLRGVHIDGVTCDGAQALGRGVTITRSLFTDDGHDVTCAGHFPPGAGVYMQRTHNRSDFIGPAVTHTIFISDGPALDDGAIAGDTFSDNDVANGDGWTAVNLYGATGWTVKGNTIVQPGTPAGSHPSAIALCNDSRATTNILRALLKQRHLSVRPVPLGSLNTISGNHLSSSYGLLVTARATVSHVSAVDDLVAALPLPKALKKGTTKPTVSVVRLQGMITPTASPLGRGALNLVAVEGALKDAFTAKGVQAVALAINSPGGSPTQSALIGDRIRDLRAEHDVPVLAFCEDVAASGGYWLACAADEIIAHPTSLVGSIGVISSGFGFDELISRYGVERRIYTAGTNKHRLDPFQPESPDDVVWLSSELEALHALFKAWVIDRRRGKLTDDEAIFSGEVFTGGKAHELGLVDELGTLNGVLAKRFPKAELSTVEPRRGLLAKLGGLPGMGPDALLDALERRAAWSRYGL